MLYPWDLNLEGGGKFAEIKHACAWGPDRGWIGYVCSGLRHGVYMCWLWVGVGVSVCVDGAVGESFLIYFEFETWKRVSRSPGQSGIR